MASLQRIPVILALLILPGVARADNLGVLVFPVIVWPLGAVFCISLIVLGTIAAVKLGKKEPKPGDRTFGKWVVGTSLAEALVYPFLVSRLTTIWWGFNDLTVISLAPVLVLAAACLILGLALVRKKVQRSAGKHHPDEPDRQDQ